MLMRREGKLGKVKEKSLWRVENFKESIETVGKSQEEVPSVEVVFWRKRKREWGSTKLKE